jgi:2-oxoglutarate dehydrogenase E2 component (dihydrolipoamide succinyltransferase)
MPDNSGGASASQSDAAPAAALGGMVTREQVAARVAARTRPLERPASGNGRNPAVAAPAQRAAAPPVVAAPSTEGDTVVELSPIRKRIAANLTHSLATAAHTLVVTEVDYSRVEPVRVTNGLSYLPFVARAVIDALRQYPLMNATLDGDSLVVHRSINIGISVDLDFQGLVVPVVRDADLLRLVTLAEQLRTVATRARSRQLTVDDLTGGTFTITNAGGYGTVVTGPIINAPQVAILSTDGVRMRPSAVPDGEGGWSIGVRPIGNLSLSFDHRAFDGAYAAAFLAQVRDSLVEREWQDEV